MILDLLNPFTVTPEMRVFRARAKKLLGTRYIGESIAFRRMIKAEGTSIVDGATRIFVRLSRRGYLTGAALAIAACVDLIEAEEKEFCASPLIHPSAVSGRFDAIKGFMKSRGLRFINLQTWEKSCAF